MTNKFQISNSNKSKRLSNENYIISACLKFGDCYLLF